MEAQVGDQPNPSSKRLELAEAADATTQPSFRLPFQDTAPS